ncbi:hypothetical protein POM88_001097 [Heracleum sosnowskyi]|uniref:Uncharacterized protein n=1 Tax=Heracleum sosnowskyi TaxID=360622 RepID=A0AAD8NA14_9APIA|nr:hypothetical protein POM88_001097 [Heracleum sosnowskyi]
MARFLLAEFSYATLEHPLLPRSGKTTIRFSFPLREIGHEDMQPHNLRTSAQTLYGTEKAWKLGVLAPNVFELMPLNVGWLLFMLVFQVCFAETVPLRTVNGQCSSGLQAVEDVAAAINARFSDIGIKPLQNQFPSSQEHAELLAEEWIQCK